MNQELNWYVVRDPKTGKLADGFYGWDSWLHSEEQIFSEDSLPYIRDSSYQFIKVAVSNCRPELNYVLDKLNYLGYLK